MTTSTHRPADGPHGPIFDAHLHIIDPRFPLVENAGYLPPPFTVADYLDAVAPLGVQGGAVVSGSFQGFDQSYLTAALDELGPGYVGVTQVPPSITDEEVRRLDAAGVRAVRFNLRRGGSAGANALEELGRRVHDVAGWHVEVYVEATHLDAIAPTLRSLPRVVVDHLGITRDGFDVLLALVSEGIRVKASGFGRTDMDVPSALQAIARENPAALLFGTDLPGTRAPRPFDPADIDVLVSALGPGLARRALWDNARALYRPVR